MSQPSPMLDDQQEPADAGQLLPQDSAKEIDAINDSGYELAPVIEVEPVAPPASLLSNKWIWVVAAAGVLAIPVSLYASGVVGPKAQPQVVATPLPSATVNAVSALGRIEPEGEVIKLGASAAQTTLLKELLVKEGDKVTAGQVVAILDSSATKQAQLAKAREEIRVAQTNLDKVKAGAKTGEISAQQAEINRLQEQLRGETTTAQATLTRLQEQLRWEPQAQNSKIQSLAAQLAGEKPTYQARINRLNAQLRNAEVECQRYKTLWAQRVIETSRRDSKCLEPETIQQQLSETAAQYRQSVSVIQQQIAEGTSTRSQMVSSLTQQIREAQATYNRNVATINEQIKQAKANLDRVAEVRPVDVRAAEAEVARAMVGVRQAQADLELSYVRAPIAGEVFKIHTRPGEAMDAKGIIELAQNDRMVAIAEIYESDIGKIKLDQIAEIKSETGSFPGMIQGKVSQIGLQIAKKDVLNTDPAADADARVVEVKIMLDPSDSDKVRGLTNSKVEVKIKN